MNEIKTDVEINTSTQKIWKIITNFEKYPDWNRFLPKVWKYKNDRPMAGQAFWEKVYIQKGFYMPLPMRFINWEENKELSFWGRTPWIFAIFSFGYHIFTLHEISENQCRFQHRYINSGLIMDTAFRFKFIRKDIERVQRQMNYDLKILAEKENNTNSIK